jgi:hypothetical protein
MVGALGWVEVAGLAVMVLLTVAVIAGVVRWAARRAR